MSINYFSSELPQANWWPRHQIMESFTESTPVSSNSTVNQTINFDLNNNEIDHMKEDIGYPRQEIPKLPLFEKPLTPSDVGKLNRLVIPKQHAEKYFPINAVVVTTESGGGGGNGKGMLLSFEDELGNPWKFRYSYWNSSQSYVLTKGWSRFVKEKKLDAGDVVKFERHRDDNERFFIGWRRRKISGGELVNCAPAVVVTGGNGGGGGWSRRLLFSEQQTYPAPPDHGPVLPYLPDCFHAGGPEGRGRGGGEEGMQNGTSGNCKRLRLFGVNMECEAEETPSDDSGSSASSNPDPTINYHNGYQYYLQLHAANYPMTHVDVDLQRDMSHRRYEQG